MTCLDTRVTALGVTRRAVETEIEAITKSRWVRQVIKPTLTGDQPTELRLTWRTDIRAGQRLENQIFGKRILFTNRDTWTTAEVVGPVGLG